MTTKNSNEKVLTKDIFNATYLRSMTLEWSWNYERQGNMGYCYAMIPALNKIYDKKEDRAKAYQRHLEFFNITPWIVTFVLGISIAMEEENAKNPDFDEQSINNVKIALMGPLSGIGDSIFWGTLRVIATGVGTSLAMNGNILGPILFLLIFNIPALLVRWFGLKWGYNLGTNLINNVQESGLMNRLSKTASIIGLTVVGAMTATMVDINMPFTIGAGEDAMTITQLADSIIPGILPLIFTLFIFYLVKKDVKSHWILLIIALIGIFGAYTGLLGVN